MSSAAGIGKVLVVDDDEQYLKVTARVLRSAGYEVVSRSDVLGTSFAVVSERPDMVLCDLNMPLVNGDRLVPLIQRALVEPPYIVLYSGIDEKLLEARSLACGADGSIPKGLEPAQFLERVAHYFARTRRRADASPGPQSTMQGTPLQIDAGFEALLGGHTVEELDAEPGSVVGLWPDGSIAFMNSAWLRFAEQNGGSEVLRRWPIGSDLLRGITGPLRDYYARAFAQVREQQKPWEQSYDCNAATQRRQFQLRVLPLDQRGMLLIHSPRFDAPMPIENKPPNGAASLLSEYVGPSGLIRQCSNCRRSQRAHGDRWDWVRAFIENPPPNVTHGICPVCLRQDYGDLAEPTLPPPPASSLTSKNR
jgi:CheY-like chemotaxis protein